MSKKVFNTFFYILIILEFFIIVYAIFFDTSKSINKNNTSPFSETDIVWADSTLQNMSIEEKISQLICFELNNVNFNIKNDLDSLILKHNIGGLKFVNTNVAEQLILSNFSRSISKYPIFIASEGSLINQKDFNFPIGIILSSIKDTVFVNNYIKHFAEILSYENINIDFSNSTATIDTIDFSFKNFSKNWNRNKYLGEKYRNLLHSKKIISSIDYSNDLFFYEDTVAVDTLIEQNNFLPLEKYMAIRISNKFAKKIIKNNKKLKLNIFLEKYYNYKALIFSEISDSINKKAINKLFNTGTDIFIVNKDIIKLKEIFFSLLNEGKISEQDINIKVRKILLAKSSLKLHKVRFQSAEQSLQKIYTKKNKLLSWKINYSSVTLIKNRGNIIPFKNLLNKKAHLLIIGNSNLQYLHKYLNYYLDVSKSNIENKDFNIKKYKKYRTIILAIDNVNYNYFNDTVFIKKIKQLRKNRNIVLLNFSNPFIINKLEFVPTIIQLYNNNSITQKVAAQVIAGAMEPKGKFPLYISKKRNKSFYKIDRLKYTIPELSGFDSEKLKSIDTIIDWAIVNGAMPGCMILAAKNKKVFYYKSFGYKTYQQRNKVKNNFLFDLASITKVAATTLASMKLYEIDSINLQDSIKYYIEDTINCTVKNHKLIDFYIHKTGLPPDMPILPYISYRDSVTKRYDKFYSKIKDSIHTIKVADNYFFDKNYHDTIVKSLYNLEIDIEKRYKYSDVNFNIIFDIINRKIKTSFVKYLNTNFYKPLQLRTMGYLPFKKFGENQTMPTQKDRYWRKQLLHGTVHDESAAIYGGVAGNAGLFSNANDLAILFQMLLNGGSYAGEKILSKETVEYFTAIQENSRRAIGFSRKRGGYFGHTGFTGCVVWANPRTNVIYIFLSNSIHPRATNKKLRRYKIREKVFNTIINAQ